MQFVANTEERLIGDTLGGYRLIAELGSGSMGEVYFAEHETIGRRAAIKVIRPGLATNKELLTRFFNEARAVNNIRHPNIVDVTDLGSFKDRYFIVMELLEGETLGERLERGALDEESIIRIADQMMAALAAAHEHGVVHRDLKPENIFITNHPDYPDYVKLLDFGVAKLLNTIEGNRTQAGNLLGTPMYMSPEQCRGKSNLDHRADIYSLGAVLYEMTTGMAPFTGESYTEILIAQLEYMPMKPRELRPEISPQLAAMIMKALSKSADERYPSMHDMRNELRSFAGLAAVPRFEAKAIGTDAGFEAPPTPASSATIAVPNADKREARPPVAKARHVGDETLLPPDEEPTETQPVARVDPIVEQLKKIIMTRLEQDRLVLPTIPTAASKCLSLLQRPNTTFGELANLLERDPMLAPQLLRMANSAVFGGTADIQSMEHALSRLGLERTKTALVELSAHRVFQSKDSRIRKAFRGIWEHSLAVGLLARQVANRHNPRLADAAYLAGLLHDVGKPVVASLLLEAEKQGQLGRQAQWLDGDSWLDVVQAVHRQVGTAIATKWQMPNGVADAIRGCSEYVEDDNAIIVNYVCYANALAKQRGIRPEGEEVQDDHADALIKAGETVLGLTDTLADSLMSATMIELGTKSV